MNSKHVPPHTSVDAAEIAPEEVSQENVSGSAGIVLDDEFFSAEHIVPNLPPETDFADNVLPLVEDQPAVATPPIALDYEQAADEYPTVEVELCFADVADQSERVLGAAPALQHSGTTVTMPAPEFVEPLLVEAVSELDDLSAALANPLDLLETAPPSEVSMAVPPAPPRGHADVPEVVLPDVVAADAEDMPALADASPDVPAETARPRTLELSAEELTGEPVLGGAEFGADAVLAVEPEELLPPAPQEPRVPHMDAVPRYAPFVVDCGLGRFAVSKDQARVLADEEVLPQWHLVMVDFSTAPGPGVLVVETAPKYAHVLAQRTLQRNGELGDDVDFRPLTRRRIAATQTLLAYQLTPKQQLTRLQAQAERSAQGFLLHSSETLLHGLLCTWPRGQTISLLMHLPQALVLVVGKDKDILWARRYALASDDGPDFQTSVSAVLHDMRLASRENGFDVDATVWVEGWSATAVMPQDQDTSLLCLPVLPLHDGEQVWYSALPGVQERMEHSLAFTPAADRALARMQPWEKWFWVVSLLVGLFLGGAGWWLGESTRVAEQHLDAVAQHKSNLHQALADAVASTTFPETDRRSLDLALETSQPLRRAHLAPPLAVLWGQIAELRPQSCRIQALEVTYEGPLVRVRLEGSIELGLTQAQAVFSEFLNALAQTGLRVAQHDFRLDLDTNFFTVMLEKTAEE